MKKIFSITIILTLGFTCLFSACQSSQKKSVTSSSKCTEGNCINGKGTMTHYNNDVIFGTTSGTFKDGKLNGQGILSTANGNKYVGEFKDSRQNGKGKFYIKNQQIYDGQWKDGKMSGKGKYTYVGNSYYVGDWLNGNRNGQGILYNADGSIKAKGQWKDDKLISEKK